MRTLLLLLMAVVVAGAWQESGSKPPSPSQKVEPEYTQAAKDAKIEGLVVLTCLITAEGIPTEIQVKRSLDSGLDQKAVEALGKWRFHPAEKDGKPTEAKATIEINFRLK